MRILTGRSAYHDVNGKGGSTQLTCSLFSSCHNSSDADNVGGQTQPDGSVDFIINSDGFCHQWFWVEYEEYQGLRCRVLGWINKLSECNKYFVKISFCCTLVIHPIDCLWLQTPPLFRPFEATLHRGRDFDFDLTSSCFWLNQDMTSMSDHSPSKAYNQWQD